MEAEKALVPKVILPQKKKVVKRKSRRKSKEDPSTSSLTLYEILPQTSRAHGEAFGLFSITLGLAFTVLLVNGLRGMTPNSSAGMLQWFFMNFGLSLFFLPLFFLISGLQLFFKSKLTLSKKNLVGNFFLYLSILGLLGYEGGKIGGWVRSSCSQWIGQTPAVILFTGLLCSSLVFVFNDVYRDILAVIYFLFKRVFLAVFAVTNKVFRGLFKLASSLWSSLSKLNHSVIEEECKSLATISFSPLDKSGIDEIKEGETSAADAVTFCTTENDVNSVTERDTPLVKNASEESVVPEVPVKKVLATVATSSSSSSSASGADSGESDYRFHRINLPGLNLLSQLNKEELQEIRATNESYILEKKETLLSCFHDFKVPVAISSVTIGSSIIRYEVKPEKGTGVAQISKLKNDISLYLATESVRIEAPIPGKDSVGIEIPLKKPYPVRFSDLITDRKFQRYSGELLFALGKDITGENVFADLAKMPHLLVAGQTGSGKSVGINCIINSILYRATPEEVRFIMIDPKVVELSLYNSLPHLLAPVVTDATEAPAVLMWAVEEMEKRYLRLEKMKVRDIKSFNKCIEKQIDEDPEADIERMPYIVIFIDELNDLMMVAKKEIEGSIIRIAQKARAVGIHLVVATQRPSKDVITGVLKGNLPSRIAFQVASWIDSKTILDRAGAEILLGNGDMLFTPVGKPKPVRVQGAFISTEECQSVIEHFASQDYEPDFVDLRPDEIVNSEGECTDIKDIDPKIYEILEFLSFEGESSVSSIQRRFSIGYNRAARIVDKLDALGLFEPKTSGVKKRKVTARINEYVSNRGEYVS